MDVSVALIVTHLQISQKSFSHAQNKQSRANSSTLVQPLTHTLPTMLGTCTRYFNNVLGGGGGGGEATHFETDNSAFLKLRFKNRKLMQLHKCPNEFCPALQFLIKDIWDI